jgi:hypothetical protein
VIVAVTALPTALVDTATVALVVPAAIVTVAGTPAAALLLDRARVSPPLGAAAPIVRVAVGFVTAPVTVLALSVTLDTVWGFTASVADLLLPA